MHGSRCPRLWYKKELPIRKGPFTLGRWQKPINYIAVVWTVFIGVILFFPASCPVTVLHINRAVVVSAGIGAFALLR
jgi:hypothetical protein